jgi:release factor glutamine methyltransferase
MAITLKSLLHDARARLDATVPEARLDEEVLLCHVLGRPRGFLWAWPEFEPGAAAVARFGALLERRRRGEPVAYLVGEREFWSLPLKLNGHTLIPRPETELLVERALDRIPTEARWTIADLGTGSGAIALAIASERPRCRVIATDVSKEALARARENALALGIDNVEFRHGSWLVPLGTLACELIVSNPPYIAAADRHLAAPELGFEPRDALVSGASGLEALTTIALDAPARLAPGGKLMLEHGFDQRESLAGILAGAGYENISGSRDFSGHDRVMVAAWPEQDPDRI